eukprot:CAMPEP_0172196274 /NCGR_PEP_ID=MMETSP1050-20130122/26720_1 /TAXON_ID=233186 /ORGANISM="Cryptomonas curvata, Strain CCAP979/52" /LENGTH=172 /DNA_ID=CAMNT_0012872525 /DNA_START=27 /DNA_END=542 /DNA_ORIENTATION=+
MAAQMGRADCVEILTQVLSVDVEQRDDTGWTPPHFASYGGHFECIRLLHSAGFDIRARADDGATPVFTAAREGRADSIRALLELQADIAAANRRGQSPVWIAAQQGHAECVQVLLNAGADAGAADNQGESPVWAAASGHGLEIEARADAGARCEEDGGTSFGSAAHGGHVEC